MNNYAVVVFTVTRVCFVNICAVMRGGPAVAQWLKRCATNRKVAGSIPDGVIGIFH